MRGTPGRPDSGEDSPKGAEEAQGDGQDGPGASARPEAGAAHGIGTTIVALVLGQTCLHSCMAGLRMATPLYALSAGYGAAAVGFLLALFAMAATVLAIPAGKLADRYGSRPPLLLAIAMGFVGGALLTITASYWAMCAAAALSGAAANIGMISMQRSGSRLVDSPAELRRVFGWMGLAPALSNFIGPLTAGWLIDLAGFRWSFAVITLMPLAGLIAAHYLPKERPEQITAAPDAKPTRTWDLLGSVQLRRLLVINWLLSACWDVHAFVLPILGHERGLSASAIGTILGMFAVAVGVVRVFLPRLLGNGVSEAQVLRSAMVLAALLFAVYPFMGNGWTMGICSALLGLVLGGAQPIIMSALHQLTPEGRHGEAIALRSMTINLSSTAMPLLFGALGAVLGAGPLFWVMGVAVGAGSWRTRGLDPASAKT